MLTRVQINKAINDLIKAKFTGIPIQSRDVEEGFDRPSFFVSIETNRTETFQSNMLRDMTCRILYFPSDQHIFKEEAYNVTDQLESLFGLNFAVVDRVITIDDAESFIVDKVVHYDFNFSYYEDAQVEDESELIEELEYNV
jgi:hypothetical protein